MNETRVIAIGPENPDFGSWNWVGTSFLEGLNEHFRTTTFADPAAPPDADLVIYIKFLPPADRLRQICATRKIVFCPIDIYGSAADIDADAARLKCCSLTIVHSGRLTRYFTSYCPVACLDHPLKYVLPEPRPFSEDAPLFWTGRQCNLGPLVDWANSQSLGRELLVLTDDSDGPIDAGQLGFSAKNQVRVEEWTPTRHVEWLPYVTAGVDIKGRDFRSRHKPPAKMLDLLASGLPVIANASSPSYWLARQQGLCVLDADHWQQELRDVDRALLMTQAWQLHSALSQDNCGDQLVTHIRQLQARTDKRIAP